MERQKKVLFIILLCVFSGSCRFESSVNLCKLENNCIIEKQKKGKQVEPFKTMFIDDDEFFFDVIDNDLSYSYFKENFKVIKKEVIKNQHNISLSDTLVSFSKGKDTANFYLSTTNAILLTVVANSKEIILSDSIRVGVDSDLIKSRFNLNLKLDSLFIEDFEASGYFLFTFHKCKLEKIIYKAKYID